MTATIINGNEVAKRIQAGIAEDAAKFKKQYGFAPVLGAVLAGDDPASQMYVNMKVKRCKDAGIESVTHVLSDESTQEEVEAIIEELNNDPRVHGILVQLPLPKQINEEAALRKVSLEKDVDGFHPINIGKLAQKGREPSFTPATPTGCMTLLKEVNAEISGANAVVVGRSNIVGMPMALMLVKANATVTICHSRTKDLAEVVRQADIVVAAIGWADFVKGDWIKPGAVVIDVGTNKVDDPEAKRGYRWVGDVEFETAKENARAITQVPGGVGPMTIATLLQNTMKAAWNIAGK
jgi:methylenetetrahydrofolate dehydrogenase (NADP+) / methenyltetrahydrofolate cyclohydrolase